MINLEPKTSPRFFLIYKFIEIEHQALKEFMQENLKLGQIRPSQLLIEYPILFILKKNKKLRLYINYR